MSKVPGLAALVGVGTCLTVATPGFSQITKSEPPPSPTSPLPNTTGTAEDARTGLAEIIVTAQRRSENVQDVPIAISVVSGRQITQSGYKGLADIQYLVPGVQYDPAGGSGFQIRGVGTQVFDYSTEQAVGIVIDDVVYDLPRNPGIDGLADVDRVEVLKGPQGTLFGKNASAGVISVTTKQPDLNKFDGDFYASYGARHDRRVNGSLNIPLASIAALRVSVFDNGQSGLTKDPVIDRRLGTVSNLGTRAKLLVKPSSGLDVTITGDISRHVDDTQTFGVLRSANAGYTASSAAAGVPVSGANRDIAQPESPYARYTNKGVSIVANWRLSGATLTSVTAYRLLDYDQSAPIDFDPTNQFLPFNIGHISGKKVSQELRLASTGRSRLHYVLGLFFNQLTLDSTQQQAGRLGAILPPGLFLSSTNGTSDYKNRITSKAAFANVGYDLSDKFDIDFGARLTSDINSARFSYDTSPLAYYYLPVSPTPDPNGRATKTNFSYRVAPTYKISDNLRVYVTRSTGYKGPGVAYLSGLRQSYRAETVSSWEVGLKSELFNRAIRLNLDAFNQKYKDFQAQDIEFVNGVPTFFIVNAGGLRARGVEGQVDWKVSGGILLSGGVTYADSIFTDYVRTGVQLAGTSLANAPKLSATASASLDRPISSALNFHGAINGSYRSMTYETIADPASRQSGYALVNGEVAVGPPDDHWRGGIYVRNLLNKEFTVATTSFAFGSARLIPNDARRTVGGFLQYSF